MREIDECTAEVFRRSEKRIKERRRNRVLALCIPVCLFIAVWPAINLPAMTPVLEGDYYNQTSGEMAENAPSLICPYIAVEIQDSDLFPEEHHGGEVTDQLAVTEMFLAVRSLFADAFSDGQNVIPAEENNINGDLVQSPNKPKGYTITFTAEDGSQTVYHLSGNTLVNVSADETVFLSDAQVAGLMAVLGISK